MRTATMSVWPLVVAFTHVFAHDYAHGRAEQSVMPKLRKGEEWAVLLRKQIKGEVGQGFKVLALICCSWIFRKVYGAI